MSSRLTLRSLAALAFALASCSRVGRAAMRRAAAAARRTSKRASCRRWRSACRSTPLVVDIKRADWTLGRYGGEMRMLMAKDRDIRMMVVYGYSRLVGYDEQLKLVPDILESVENVGEPRSSRCTCAPATDGRTAIRSPSADFRYYWEDVANNPTFRRSACRSPDGRGKRPALRSAERDRGPLHLGRAEPACSSRRSPGRVPLYIYRPAHYLRQFHAKYIGSTRRRPRPKRGRLAQLGRASTRRRTSSTASTIRTCRRSSPGSTRRRCPRRASCSCATRISIASTRRAGSFPISTASSSTSPTAS